MTWQHYQQWRQDMSAHLSRRLGEQQLQAGSGARIDGSFISLLSQPQRPRPVRDPTWELYLWGRYEGTIFGESIGDNLPWERAARVDRRYGHLHSSYFWEGSQAFTLPEVGGREVTIFFEARTHHPHQGAYDPNWISGLGAYESDRFENGIHRFPVRLVLEEHTVNHGSWIERRIATHEIIIGPNGARFPFSNPEAQWHYVRPLSIERV